METQISEIRTDIATLRTRQDMMIDRLGRMDADATWYRRIAIIALGLVAAWLKGII